MREVSVIMGSELIETFKIMWHLGMPPMRSFHIRSRMDVADIVGIGDNGVEAVRRLMESGCENAAYLVLHRDEKKLRQTKADTIAMKDDSWKVVENVMTAPFESLPISYQKFCFYYRQTWRFYIRLLCWQIFRRRLEGRLRLLQRRTQCMALRKKSP